MKLAARHTAFDLCLLRRRGIIKCSSIAALPVSAVVNLQLDPPNGVKKTVLRLRWTVECHYFLLRRYVHVSALYAVVVHVSVCLSVTHGH